MFPHLKIGHRAQYIIYVYLIIIVVGVYCLYCNIFLVLLKQEGGGANLSSRPRPPWWLVVSASWLSPLFLLRARARQYNQLLYDFLLLLFDLPHVGRL